MQGKDRMKETAFGIIILLFIFLLLKKIKARENNKEKSDEKLNLQHIYQPRWLFSYHEKEAYWKLKKIAERNGYILFAKVRLHDLVEPVRGCSQYMTYLNKVQAKHVDFVLCSQKLVAKAVIELDDRSHDDPKRKERDRFVDAALKAAGYKILHIRTVDEREVERFLLK